MTNYWKFTDLEYMVGWRAFGWDRLHYPLNHQATASMQSEYNLQCAQAAKVFEAQWDDDLYGVFVTLASPTARLHACGFVGADNTRKVRIYAGIGRQTGAVVAQEPRGTVHVYRVPGGAVGQRVAAALPPMGPGRRSGVEAYHADLESRVDDDAGAPATWMQPVDVRPTAKQHMVGLATAPRVGVGQIEVYPGPMLDKRNTGGKRELHWLDLADDGRYEITETRQTMAARPIDTQAMGLRLQQLLNQAAAQHIERSSAAS